MPFVLSPSRALLALAGCVLLVAPALAQWVRPDSDLLHPVAAQPLPVRPRASAPFAPLPGAQGRLVLRDGPMGALLADDGLAISLVRGSGWGLRWGVSGARAIAARPTDPQPARVHWLVGAPESWRTDLPTFGGATWEGVLPGVDVRIASRPHGVAYSLHAEPGSVERAITLQYKGAEELSVEEGGRSLGVRTGLGWLHETGLRCFQPSAIETREVACRYARVRAGERGAWLYDIEVDDLDRAAPLVVDPEISWSTFLGGDSIENPGGIALDAKGNVYVAGETLSGANVATTGAFDTTLGGNKDAFVAKLSADGATLAWATYLGGGGDDSATALAVDSSGRVYVAGTTGSGAAGAAFPVVAGGFDGTFNGGAVDGFVVRLNAQGKALDWGSFLGGSADDYPTAITLDALQNVYVGGYTVSNDFPYLNGFDRKVEGTEAFVTKIQAGGAALAWSSLLGGRGSEQVHAIAVDLSGNVYLAGESSSSDMPVTTGAYDRTLGSTDGSTDGFVAKIAASGASIAWATYLGGSAYDSVNALALDVLGGVVVAGGTMSSDFPTTAGAFDKTFGGPMDAFVARLSPTGAALSWSTFLGGALPSVGGGEANDAAFGIALDSQDDVYVTGQTAALDFPSTGGFDLVCEGADAFVTKLAAGGGAVSWSSYLGGSGGDLGSRIGLDPWGNVIVAGYTGSSGFTNDFPSTPGSVDATFNGIRDVFVTRVRQDMTPPSAGTVNDGDAEDLDTQASRTALSANWFGFADPETGIVRYEWMIGTTPGGSDVRPATSVGTATRATATGLSLQPGATYYVRVRAVNGAGLSTTASSDGVTVERDRPDAGLLPDAGTPADAGETYPPDAGTDAPDAGTTGTGEAQSLFGWSCSSAQGVFGAWLVLVPLVLRRRRAR